MNAPVVNTAPINVLLQRLEAVKAVGRSRWVARCPAHADKTPSLSVREASDGRVLIHDFAGCSAVEVLSALGLSLADLFEKPVAHCLPKSGMTFPALPALKALTHEVRIVFFCGASMMAGEGFDASRLKVALGRIDAALRVVEGRA